MDSVNRGFVAVAFLSKYKLQIDPGFNPHLFATANAIIQFNGGHIITRRIDYSKTKKIPAT
jgi:hypothetical protein